MGRVQGASALHELLKKWAQIEHMCELVKKLIVVFFCFCFLKAKAWVVLKGEKKPIKLHIHMHWN